MLRRVPEVDIVMGERASSARRHPCIRRGAGALLRCAGLSQCTGPFQGPSRGEAPQEGSARAARPPSTLHGSLLSRAAGSPSTTPPTRLSRASPRVCRPPVRQPHRGAAGPGRRGAGGGHRPRRGARGHHGAAPREPDHRLGQRHLRVQRKVHLLRGALHQVRGAGATRVHGSVGAPNTWQRVKRCGAEEAVACAWGARVIVQGPGAEPQGRGHSARDAGAGRGGLQGGARSGGGGGGGGPPLGGGATGSP